MEFLNSFILITNYIIIPGLTYGSQLALGALGITIVYTVLRFSNFAHGEFMSFGTMSTILLTWIFIDNNIKFRTSEMSKYSILEDMDPPVIERIKFNSDQMKFRIYDELSGIKSYEGRINNNWILFEYDNKNDVIISKKKNSIQSFKGKFVLEVIDNANNRRTLNLNL